MDICIICRTKFSYDNPKTKEHIIPLAIGGARVIDTVCKKCNSRMGTAIDAPFLDNIISRMYIEENNIVGRKGRIEFPFKGHYTDDDGNKYLVKDMDSAPILLNSKPNIFIDKLSNGQYSVSITTHKYGHFTEEDIKKYLENYGGYIRKTLEAKELILPEINVKDFTTTSFESNRLKRRELVDFNPFFLEALKIAYEFFVTDYPYAIEHEDIKKIAKIILTADMDLARDYVGLRVDTSFAHNFVNLKAKYGKFHLVSGLVPPCGGTGYFISLYENYVFMVQLSKDVLFNKELIPYIYFVEKRKSFLELSQNEIEELNHI